MKLLPGLLLLFLLFPGYAQDRIVFQRSGQLAIDIFLMNADGTWQKNLTNGAIDERNGEPAISPDGKSVLFVTNRNGLGSQIFVMDLVSRHARSIAEWFTLEHSPAWSPDGQTFAFSSCGNNYYPCDIYTARIDGVGGYTELPTNTKADDDNPHFSPDGSKILFVTNRNGSGYEIYVCDSNGSNLRRLTTNNVDDLAPQWSPDGSRIIFASQQAGLVTELYVMNADGSNVVRLTHSQGNGQDNYSPAFSSDGRRVVWERKFGSNYEIVEASLEDMDQPRRLTNNVVSDIAPDYGFITRKVGRFH